MGKQTYHPYMQPIVPGFESRNYLSKSKIILEFLKKTSLKKLKWSESKDWISINNEKLFKSMKKSNTWGPKLYMCVGAKDYWSVVADLISLSEGSSLAWKFCKLQRYSARPDKIVIYATTVKELKKIVKLIRPLLKNKSVHTLEFASNSVESRLERSGKGIFVGLDPRFLKGVSWRFYRWAINEAVINPQKGRFDKNTLAALKLLNVSLKHKGPYTLSPPAKNNKTIKQIWKKVIA